VDTAVPLRLLVIADGFGATQQISFITPLRRWRAAGAAAIRLIDERQLQKVRHKAGADGVEAFLEGEFRVFRPTILILSRYAGEDHGTLFALASANRIPVVYHLDDDIFETPIALGIDIYRRYNHPRRVHAMYRIAEGADLVFTSTPTLAERVRQRLKPKRLIVADAYVGADVHDPAGPESAGSKPPGEVRLGYMASAGHAFDFELAEGAVTSLLLAIPQLTFHLFGSIAGPGVAEIAGERVVRQLRVAGSYEDFRKALGGLGWDIGLAPLRNNDFNACKAPTKWI